MKFCAKCGKRVDGTKCPYCNYSQDKTFISLKIRQSKKNFFFIGSGVFVAIVVALTLNWAINDGHGPLYDRGDFVLTYEPVFFVEGEKIDLTVTTERNQKIADLVRSTKFFENTVNNFNKKFKLPHDVPVYVGQCNERNAFWVPDLDFMVICYELIDLQLEIVYTLYPQISDNELIQFSQDGTYWIIVHELGHAFIDVYQLPLLGPPEDTADAAANIILISEGQAGIDAVLSATDFFSYLSQEEVIDIVFYDNHGLSAQRYVDAMCFLYGSDPSKFTGLVEEGYLTVERSQTCEQDYQDNYAGWAQLLEPYTKFEL